MKTKNIIRGLVAFFLIATTIVSLAYAGSSMPIGVTALWTENDSTSLSVEQGERAELYVSIESTLDYTLQVELLRGSEVIQTIVPGTVYPATLEDSTSSHTLAVDTSDLAGVYAVRVHVVNAEGDSTQWPTLNVKTAPLLSSVPDRAVDENRTIIVGFTTSDADGDAEFTLEAYQQYCILEGTRFETCLRFSLPEEFRFIDAGSGVGRVIIQPGYDFVTHPDRTEVTQLIFRAYDGRNYSPWEYAAVTVNDVNRLPEIFSAPVLTAQEGSLYRYDVLAADDDEEDRLRYYLASSLITFGPTIDSRGRISWTPNYDQAGEIDVAVYVTDGWGTITQNFTITVENTNRAPVLDSIGDKDAAEGEELNFTITGSDPDGDLIMFSVAGLPEGAIFDPATQTFNWTPTFEQTGNYQVTFSVTDGTLTDRETITISVGNVNRPPVLDPIGDRAVNEGELLEINFSATDPDGDSLVWWTQGLPAGSMLTIYDSGTALLSWTPGSEDAGIYPFTIFVSDGELEDTESIIIKVVDVPEPCPDVNGNGICDADEVPPCPDVNGNGICDADEVPPCPDVNGNGICDADEVPPCPDVNGNGVCDDEEEVGCMDPAALNFNPDADIPGSCTYEEPCPDVNGNGICDNEEPGNRAPVLDLIGDKEVAEGTELTFTVSGSDPDGDVLTFSAVGLPLDMPLSIRAVFNAATKTFTWTPNLTQAGAYDVTFTVTDGQAQDSEVVRITVTNVEEIIFGCTDSVAVNFQPQADRNDGSCIYPELDDILELTRVQLSSEIVAAGDTLLLNIHVANEGDLDVENLRITVLAYDLGLNRTTSRFDLDEGRTASKLMALPLPEEVPAGDYLLKITVGNREHRESTYRMVHVQ